MLTLTGKASAWQRRLCRDAPVNGRGRVSQAVTRDVVAAWVHHRTFGTIGVYLSGRVEVAAPGLRRGQWLQITGTVRPLLVAALRDDPRSVLAPGDAPLLLAVTELVVLEGAPERWPELPQLVAPQRVRVGSPRLLSDGLVADVLPYGDLLHWTAHGTPQERFRDWNCVYGLVSRLGGHRFLRYLLSYRPGRKGTPNG